MMGLSRPALGRRRTKCCAQKLTLVQYTIVQRGLEAPRRPGQQDVTLSTQVTLDRWRRFEQQAAAWEGPVSVAVYIPVPRSSPHAEQFIKLAKSYWHEASCNHGTSWQVDVALLFANSVAAEGVHLAAQPVPMPGGQLTYDELYPINALRNAALLQAQTDFVFVVDGDFIPSKGLRAASQSWCLAQGATNSPVALVVPPFDLRHVGLTGEGAPVSVPRTKMELASSGALPFHCGAFAQSEPSLEYGRWWAAKELFEVPYRDFFEPHIIAQRKQLPMYDERFRGYGLNKVQLAYHMAALGFRFQVIPEHFLVTVPHARSPSWQQAFGTRRDPEHCERVLQLYRQFQHEIQQQPGMIDPLS